MALICGVRCVLDLGVSMWSSLGMVTMFYEQEVTIHHANNYSLTSLENLQGIVPLNVAALAGVCVITYIFLAAGAKSVGKISLIFIPLCYGLLITLVIRSCMEQAGPQGFLTIMTPNWSVLSNVTPWLEAEIWIEIIFWPSLMDHRVNFNIIDLQSKYFNFELKSKINLTWIRITLAFRTTLKHLYWSPITIMCYYWFKDETKLALNPIIILILWHSFIKLTPTNLWNRLEHMSSFHYNWVWVWWPTMEDTISLVTVSSVTVVSSFSDTSAGSSWRCCWSFHFMESLTTSALMITSRFPITMAPFPGS